MSCPLGITKEIVLCRLASPTNQTVCARRRTPILSFFPVALMCLLYSSSIWLQMLFIRYDYKDGSIIDEKARERTRRRRKKKQEQNLHRHGRCGCQIITILITITLLEGFIERQLQLIRLLSHLTTVDLYLDIFSFINRCTCRVVQFVYLDDFSSLQ
jgi:hypothetical protein